MEPTIEQRLAVRNRPNQTHVMYQTWRDLLFLHWKISAETIQATLPHGLTVDTYDGAAYIGLVPFYMRNIRPRYLPPVPGISWFLETNVRTYVYDENGTPGVWFYSLDCNRRLAVFLARTLFRLPYFYAKMQAKRRRGAIHYMTKRNRPKTIHPSQFHYLGWGNAREAQPDTLEFFLFERYVLFAQTRKGLATGRVHHAPYQFQPARVSVWDANLIELAGFEKPTTAPDLAHFSPGVTVDVFPLRHTKKENINAK